MVNGTPAPYALASLILRLALGTIFLYHGLEKITCKECDWGTTWADHLWHKQASVPPEVRTRLEKVELDTPDRIVEVKTKLEVIYARETQHPPLGLEYAAVQVLVAWGELLAGAALLAGFLTRLAALAMIVIQAGAIAALTWGKGFSFEEGGGYEYNLALLAICLALTLLGGGILSVDHWLGRRRKRSSLPAPAATG
jgi:uncharacterized membrane protein YphA (DoxX/SURF4 family)